MVWRTSFLAVLLLVWRALVSGAGDQETFVINLRDADIRALSEQVSEITGRTLILDPAVTGQVTVISAEPLDEAGVWDLFQSVLRVQGFAALRSGTIWRVIPQANVREAGGDLDDGADAGRLDVVTRLVQLQNFPSATAVAALRPLVASFGYIEALPETNTLVITDNAENIDRIEEIARTLDEGDGSQSLDHSRAQRRRKRDRRGPRQRPRRRGRRAGDAGRDRCQAATCCWSGAAPN